MKPVSRHSLLRSLCALFLLVLTLVGTQGYCCGDDHGFDAQDNAGESVCVCACPCHSVSATAHDVLQALVLHPLTGKHALTDEEAPNSAFVLGIDHPPKF